MYLKSINNKSIYLQTIYFIVNFLSLILVCFMVIYFFFECSDRQHKQIKKDVLGYKTVLNSQYNLQNKVDTLYYYMSLLNTGKVHNDRFLEQYIAKQIQEIKNLVESDKDGDFNYYRLLFTQLDSLLVLKNQLIQTNSEEALALKDLNECLNRFKTVQTELNEDPLRKFNTK